LFGGLANDNSHGFLNKVQGLDGSDSMWILHGT
jgi:hypothetical protein